MSTHSYSHLWTHLIWETLNREPTADVGRVARYIANQEEHHRKRTYVSGVPDVCEAVRSGVALREKPLKWLLVTAALGFIREPVNPNLKVGENERLSFSVDGPRDRRCSLGLSAVRKVLKPEN